MKLISQEVADKIMSQAKTQLRSTAPTIDGENAYDMIMREVLQDKSNPRPLLKRWLEFDKYGDLGIILYAAELLEYLMEEITPSVLVADGLPPSSVKFIRVMFVIAAWEDSGASIPHAMTLLLLSKLDR